MIWLIVSVEVRDLQSINQFHAFHLLLTIKGLSGIKFLCDSS